MSEETRLDRIERALEALIRENREAIEESRKFQRIMFRETRRTREWIQEMSECQKLVSTAISDLVRLQKPPV